jgi:dihydrodipicolinate synthase/N-acetylneuraminate lyase
MTDMKESVDRKWSWETALNGVIPPLITPLAVTGNPDGAAITTLVEYVLTGGCSGLFVLGGCGEGAWLTAGQRAAVVRAAVRAAAGRAPVLVGVMLPATGPAGEAARQAADEGADAVVVGSPYYYSVDAPTQQRHGEALLDAVSLPALLYNIPQATHHTLLPATVRMIARDSRVLGIKDSAGDFEAFLQFLGVKEKRPSFRVLQGYEHLSAASLLQGGDGLVPGLANVAPALFVALHRTARSGDASACARLQTEIEDLSTLHGNGHWLSALKAACAAIGIGTGVPAAPLPPADSDQRRSIKAVLGRHRLFG